MTATRNAGTDPPGHRAGHEPALLLPPGEHAGGRPGAVRSRKQPSGRSWIGARYAGYLHPASGRGFRRMNSRNSLANASVLLARVCERIRRHVQKARRAGGREHPGLSRPSMRPKPPAQARQGPRSRRRPPLPVRGRCSCPCLCAGQHAHSLSAISSEVAGQAVDPILRRPPCRLGTACRRWSRGG